MLLHRLTSSSQGRETIKRHVTTDHADTPFHEFRDRICPETWRASGSSNEYRLTISRHRRMPWAPFRASVKNPDAHPLPLPQLEGMGVILKGPAIEAHDIRAHGRHPFDIGGPSIGPRKICAHNSPDGGASGQHQPQFRSPWLDCSGPGAFIPTLQSHPSRSLHSPARVRYEPGFTRC